MIVQLFMNARPMQERSDKVKKLVVYGTILEFSLCSGSRRDGEERVRGAIGFHCLERPLEQRRKFQGEEAW
jgi:hypothetical protein